MNTSAPRLITERPDFLTRLGALCFPVRVGQEQRMNKWDQIRRAYDEHMPEILEARSRGLRHRTDPYFIDWIPIFTPIEEYAWHDIRSLALPLYPQFPLAGVFLDFADPRFKIGVELDGAAYHDAVTDRRRDERLCSFGWRVFRVKGRESLPSRQEPFELRSQVSPGEYHDALVEWGSRWSEGFFWALGEYYYSEHARQLERNAALNILSGHRLVEFELALQPEAGG
jgi:hypothetical protein